MAGLLFYFPKAKGGNVRQWFEEAGIGELLRADDDQPALCDANVLKGPHGEPGGRLAFWHDPSEPQRSPTPAVEKDRQTWLEAPAGDGRERGAFWVGYWNDKPPTPADLRRRKVLSSVEVELGRDKWLIPIAREMPQTYGFDADGNTAWVYEFDEHQAYFDEAMRLHRALQQTVNESRGEWLEWNEPEYLAFAFRALAFNYRVTPEVLALLKAVRRERLPHVMIEAAGMPLTPFEAKKPEADTSVGAVG